MKRWFAISSKCEEGCEDRPLLLSKHTYISLSSNTGVCFSCKLFHDFYNQLLFMLGSCYHGAYTRPLVNQH